MARCSVLLRGSEVVRRSESQPSGACPGPQPAGVLTAASQRLCLHHRLRVWTEWSRTCWHEVRRPLLKDGCGNTLSLPTRLCRDAVRSTGQEESVGLRFSFWHETGLPVPEGGVCVDLEVSRVFLQGPCPMGGTWCPNLLLMGDWAGCRVAAGTGVASETVPCGHPYVSTGKGPVSALTW